MTDLFRLLSGILPESLLRKHSKTANLVVALVAIGEHELALCDIPLDVLLLTLNAASVVRLLHLSLLQPGFKLCDVGCDLLGLGLEFCRARQQGVFRNQHRARTGRAPSCVGDRLGERSYLSLAGFDIVGAVGLGQSR